MSSVKFIYSVANFPKKSRTGLGHENEALIAPRDKLCKLIGSDDVNEDFH